jgi:hypothetical protein
MTNFLRAAAALLLLCCPVRADLSANGAVFTPPNSGQQGMIDDAITLIQGMDPAIGGLLNTLNQNGEIGMF